MPSVCAGNPSRRRCATPASSSTAKSAPVRALLHVCLPSICGLPQRLGCVSLGFTSASRACCFPETAASFSRMFFIRADCGCCVDLSLRTGRQTYQVTKGEQREGKRIGSAADGQVPAAGLGAGAGTEHKETKGDGKTGTQPLHRLRVANWADSFPGVLWLACSCCDAVRCSPDSGRGCGPGQGAPFWRGAFS